MNLVIDKGNTCSKVAIFDGNRLVCVHREAYLTVTLLEKLFAQYAIERTIVSTVSGLECEVEGYLRSHAVYVAFPDYASMPIRFAYEPLSALGADRVAAVLGAYFYSSERSFVSIDCGTCITFDVCVDGCYKGGCILPGMQMRYTALREHTKLLPIVEPAEHCELYANNTVGAIRAGVQGAIVYEIDGFISAVRAENGDLPVFLTGGDALFFDKWLKNRIFAVENLTLLGLNGVINYNA